uniref:Phosphatidylinositol-4-phosphate 5-kinase type 1 beta n=1 Tax=Pan troglodytes TaxID=9598 RepID=A0A2I3T6F3_PANTR
MSSAAENGEAAPGKQNEEKTYKKTASSAIKGAIQLGIGYTVGNLTSKPERDVLMQDFYVVESVFLPSEGSNLTPAHHYPDFRFKTYAPLAFRYFRELFGIPAKSHRGEKLLLFMGIIDILQSYRLMKKLEHSWKALVYDGDTVSVHRPSFYADRFLKFMNSRVFKKIQALKASPSKKRCNSIAALKATSQEIVSSVSQEWKDEKRDLLTEGQSFSSLDEEALGSRHRPDLVPSTPSLFEAASLATTISSSSLYVNEHYPHDRPTLYSNSKGLPSSSTFTLEEGTIYLTAEPNTLEVQDDNASVLDVYLVSNFLVSSPPLLVCKWIQAMAYTRTSSIKPGMLGF